MSPGEEWRLLDAFVLLTAIFPGVPSIMTARRVGRRCAGAARPVCWRRARPGCMHVRKPRGAWDHRRDQSIIARTVGQGATAVLTL